MPEIVDTDFPSIRGTSGLTDEQQESDCMNAKIFALGQVSKKVRVVDQFVHKPHQFKYEGCYKTVVDSETWTLYFLSAQQQK